MSRKTKRRKPASNPRADSWSKLAISVCILLAGSAFLFLMLTSNSMKGNIVVGWVVCGFFLLLGLSGTYTAIQELRGKYDDPDSWQLPKWMDNDMYMPERCYTRQTNGYYRLRPTVTYGCAGRFLLILGAVLGIIIAAVMAGESDFRDGIDTGGEVAAVIMGSLLPVIFLILGLRFFIEGKLGDVAVDISAPAFPGRNIEAIVLFRSRFAPNTARVELVCQEKAEIGSGSDRETKREDVCAILLCDLPNPRVSPIGELCRANITIPADAMLSFKGLHNEITWFFRITMNFTFWRNFSHDIPFRVISPEIFEQERTRWPI